MSDDERGPDSGLGRRGAGAESARPTRLRRPGYSEGGPQAPWLYNPGAPPLRPPQGPFSNVSRRVVFQAGAAEAREPSRRIGPDAARWRRTAAASCTQPLRRRLRSFAGADSADRPAMRGGWRVGWGRASGGANLWHRCAALARIAPTSPSARAVGRAAAATGPESLSPRVSVAVGPSRTREDHPVRGARLGQDPGGQVRQGLQS